MVSTTAILLLHKASLITARRIKNSLPYSKLHGSQALTKDCDIVYEDFADHIRNLFIEKQPIVAIASSGIIIRCLAECLRDKWSEPPVLAVANDGSSIIPLIGGHHGANNLAKKIAKIFNTNAAITTASESAFGLALDQPPDGYHLANPENAKVVTSAILNNHPVRVRGKADWLKNSLQEYLVTPSHSRDHDSQSEKVEIIVSEQNEIIGPETLLYHPKILAIGVGCERNCSPEEMKELVQTAIKTCNLSTQAISLLCSIDLKSDELAIHETARELGVPVRFFSAAELNRHSHRLVNPSEIVMKEVGTPGVAESACLASVGLGGSLIVEKIKSTRATCAIAKSLEPIDYRTLGHSRGILSIVGVGPGKHEWRTAESTITLEAATDVVGYDLYLDLIADLIGNKNKHRFPLGQEEGRVRFALELAGQGCNVALVSSGDAGIYAMASLAYELVDQTGAQKLTPGARRVELNVIPGITAFQAAAARAGAPMGHDFCAISLSDLLTPWPIIEKRVEAAGRGDFVIAFYNPKSKTRIRHIDRAMKILQNFRPSHTPVITASRLGRENESLSLFTIENYCFDHVDMQTIVIVGSEMSKIVETPDGKKWVYTPRGYGTSQGTD